MTNPPTPVAAPARQAPSRPSRSEAMGRARDLIERRPDLRDLALAGVVLAEAAGSA